ncbi:exodeoxyribonuclease V subunit alpha [Pseudactinotalea sp.]|uniref:exodeoxyribonuclease V subunit alpha n=1 Tax=Pseudactinotalea sp. TaxID=1926260 RepID=UPI003B3A677B
MTASAPANESANEQVDPFGRDMARSASGLLAELNHPDGLAAADVHVARRLAALGGCEDERVLVAAALTVRAVRQGSVCLDLDSPRVAELLGEHAWGADQWRAALLASPLVREAASDAVTPLVLDEHRLYLDRYWAEEGQVVRDLRARGEAAPSLPHGVEETLARYFPAAAEGETDGYADQRAAAEAACHAWTTVVTGGPGTGKTTTIARLLGVLLEREPGLRVALAAPTGRAAARRGEAITQATSRADFPAGEVKERVAALSASTVHRLLGWMPARRTFRHHRANRLPYDVVVVDETSMVSLTLMARLLDAMRPHARLVLVGDADQLASVDAGAVLGDLVAGLGEHGPAQVRTLTHSHRFGSDIGDLATAIRDDQPDRVLELLEQGGGGSDPSIELVERAADVEEQLITHAVAMRRAALDGDAAGALQLLDEHRLLCAHREGPFGAGYWNRRIERALADAEQRGSLGTWYAGRPVIVAENDYGLRLYNGDLAVVVAVEDQDQMRLEAVLASGGTDAPRRLAIGRLPDVRSAHAMTVHRSQGSQVRDVTVLLPDDASRLLTRQLLYTAVTRATHRVRVVGTEDSVRAAVGTDVPRASGLAERLTR